MYLARVTVSVPAYNRPDMLQQLIHSFMRQTYPNKELVISDDSSTDLVTSVVAKLADPRIVYVKNETNLGLTSNLRQAMNLASGRYVIIMGDDDVFLSHEAIGQYVAVFESHPSVAYTTCNKAQFSPALAIENIYTFFHHDALFAKGASSMKGIWTTSINISGIGFRNDFDLDSIYPRADLLFPQLEHIGHLVNRADSYGMAAVLIGLRAHSDQLGFLAMRGEGTKGTERHGTLELLEIYDKLARQYSLTGSADFLVRDLIARRQTDMLKEKLIVGRALVSQNYQQFCAASAIARNSTRLKLAYVASQVLPAWALRIIRRIYISQGRWRQPEAYALLSGALADMSSPQEATAASELT